MNLAIDLNTILTSLTLGGIIYVAATLKRLDKDQAVLAEKHGRLDAEFLILRARVTQAEADIAHLRVQFAGFVAAAGLDPSA